MMRDFLEAVLRAYKKKVLFTSHALDQMIASKGMISRRDVCEVVESDEIIEDYAEDPRGHSCLVIGKTKDGRIMHVVCAPKQDYLAVVTAYVPSLLEWEEDLRTRRRR